jgi:hypothetical protein
MKKTSSLADYIYIEDAVLDNYIKQISPKKNWKRNLDWKFSLSLTGPKLDVSQNISKDAGTAHEKLLLLLSFLLTENMLVLRRPFGEEDSKCNAHFVWETTVATKVIFPHERLSAIPGLSQFAVWVSDPDPSDFTDEPWKWHGTFLYLTETYWDAAGYRTTYSGCSALQAILNIVNGNEILDRNWDEPLGRNNSRHPLEKLRKAGGVVGVPQEIETLYRMRYMTNEQCFTFKGHERRVHDLLGYPISIARVASNKPMNPVGGSGVS